MAEFRFRAEEERMVTAIVLVKADVASIPETAETIAQIPGVSDNSAILCEIRLRSHTSCALLPKT